MTQIIEPLTKYDSKELNLFDYHMTQKNWTLLNLFFFSMTQRIESFFRNITQKELNPFFLEIWLKKNWIFFFWNNDSRELNLFFSNMTQENWTFLCWIWFKRIESFFSRNMTQKELNLFFIRNMTQKELNLFFWNMTQKELNLFFSWNNDSKELNLFFIWLKRIEPFCFGYDSRELNLFVLNMIIEVWIWFNEWNFCEYYSKFFICDSKFFFK